MAEAEGGSPVGSARWPGSSLLRRGFHVAAPVWLVWYWLPEDAGIGVPKLALLVLILGVALGVEAVRLVLGVDLIGLRDYERHRMAAYAWGGVGLALGLLLFPVWATAPAVVGLAWVDPLCAWTRRVGGYPALPFAAWTALGLALLLLLAVPLWPALPLALLGAAVAVAAERPNLRWVDDDFTMLVAPLLALVVARGFL